MRILAFDTATRATAVALCGVGDELLLARDDPPAGARPRHAARLLGLVDSLLDRGGIELSDLDLIAVGLGPGTFTGLRIGIASARALAQALGTPLAGVSTLQSLALCARERAEAEHLDAVAAVLDARRGEAFAAVWRLADLETSGGALVEPGAYAPEAFAQTLQELDLGVLAVGEGAVEFRVQLERSGASVPDERAELHRVTAAGHCRIARQLEATPADRIVPHYLRPPDAKEPSSNRPAPGKT